MIYYHRIEPMSTRIFKSAIEFLNEISVYMIYKGQFHIQMVTIITFHVAKYLVIGMVCHCLTSRTLTLGSTFVSLVPL